MQRGEITREIATLYQIYNNEIIMTGLVKKKNFRLIIWVDMRERKIQVDVHNSMSYSKKNSWKTLEK